MWYPAAITVPAAAEPVSLDEAKAHCRIDGDDSDALLTRLIAAARAHVEACCGVRLAVQTVEIKCDAFEDFAHLPEAPVRSISSIAYVDTEGATQSLSTDVYELRADGLEASIALKHGQRWPVIQCGSRIIVTAEVGYTAAPEDVRHAMLLLIGAWNEHREEIVAGTALNALPVSTSVHALLCNYRRGV